MQPATDFWLSFDFERFRDVDAFQKELADKTERATKSRKHLAESTREFKKAPSGGGGGGGNGNGDVGELLRLYQTEIDVLTKRSKAAETLLVDMYTALSEAPEPGPLLEHALQCDQEMAKMRFENGKLTKEVEEFEREFAKLKNQDITIRELEDKIFSLEESIEIKTQQLVHEKLTEAEKQRSDADADLQIEIRELKSTVDRAEREATEQRRAAESARIELYEIRAQTEEREASRGAELDLLQEELLFLRAQVAQYSTMEQSNNNNNNNLFPSTEQERQRKQKAMFDEEEMKRREEELSRAYLALDAARAEAQRAREAEAQAIQRRDRDADEAKVRAEAQRERERERVSELQSKLELLSSKLGNREKEEGPPLLDSATTQQNELIKNLESSLATARVSLQEREQEIQLFKTKFVALEERAGDLQELCNKLQAAEIAFGGSSGGGNSTSTVDYRHISQPGTSSSQVSDMMSIVQDQRDRFRSRMLELEEQIEGSREEAGRAMELAETLRLENLVMAEKLRSMSRFNKNGGGGNAPTNTTLTTNNGGGNSGGMFTKRTSTSGGGTTSGTSSGGESSFGFSYMFRFLLVNSFARSLFLVYILALHMLVLASTHETVLQSSCTGGGLNDGKMEKLRGSDPDRGTIKG